MPLALGLSSLSNPDLAVLDVLNKYSHDNDSEVANSAIFALGLVGAGTNNARLATMLRQLACYHAKNPLHLFLVRISQGLVHLGKVKQKKKKYTYINIDIYMKNLIHPKCLAIRFILLKFFRVLYPYLRYGMAPKYWIEQP